MATKGARNTTVVIWNFFYGAKNGCDSGMSSCHRRRRDERAVGLALPIGLSRLYSFFVS